MVELFSIWPASTAFKNLFSFGRRFTLCNSISCNFASASDRMVDLLFHRDPSKWQYLHSALCVFIVAAVSYVVGHSWVGVVVVTLVLFGHLLYSFLPIQSGMQAVLAASLQNRIKNFPILPSFIPNAPVRLDHRHTGIELVLCHYTQRRHPQQGY